MSKIINKRIKGKEGNSSTTLDTLEITSDWFKSKSHQSLYYATLRKGYTNKTLFALLDVKKEELPNSGQEKKEVTVSIKYIDYIHTYTYEKDLLELLKGINPEVRFLGDDYLGKSITKSNKKIDIKFINRDHGKSTSGYIKQILKKYEFI